MKKSHKEKYAKIVMLLASFSSADRLHVGSIILKDNRIISTGYNGHLPKRPHKAIVVNTHDISTVHSEENSLMHCAKQGISTNGCELFVSHFPCQMCTKLAIMAGIKKIYYVEDYRNNDNPFAKEIKMEKVNVKKQSL